MVTPLAILAAAFPNVTAVGGGFVFIPLFIFGYGMLSQEVLLLSLDDLVVWNELRIHWPAPVFY
jgi:hypothetical protein